jgi:arylsulfatase A-like enzyme
MKPAFVSLIALMALDVSTAPLRAVDEVKPNIIFVLADDLGFMDIRANNPKGAGVAETKRPTMRGSRR